MLHVFYAVTLTSLYSVYDQTEERPYPHAIKLALRRESGSAIGDNHPGFVVYTWENIMTGS